MHQVANEENLVRIPPVAEATKFFFKPGTLRIIDIFSLNGGIAIYITIEGRMVINWKQLKFYKKLDTNQISTA